MVPSEKASFPAEFCAERLKALSDPVRLRIVDLLCHGEMSVGDISEFLEAPLAGVSHHLQILKHADLVVTRREGRFIYYGLHPDLRRRSTRAPKGLDLGCCRLEIPESE